MKKKTIAMIAATSLIAGAVSAQAATTLEPIQASLNHGIKFILNDSPWTNDAPISYKGTTYVPLRAVAEATGANVIWDGTSQTITINSGSKDSTSTPEESGRKPFIEDTVSYLKWGYDTNGITQNKEELLFGETQYNTAFTVSGVNTTGQGVGFKVEDGAKKVGVLIGVKQAGNDKAGEFSYTIKDRDDNVLATGTLLGNELTENTLTLSEGVTDLYIEFKSKSVIAKGIGYLIWDGSWIE